MHRQFEFGLLGAIDDLDDVGVDGLAIGVEVLDEVEQPAAEEERLGAGRIGSLVEEDDLESPIEIPHLPQAGGDGVVVELGGLGEDLHGRARK